MLQNNCKIVAFIAICIIFARQTQYENMFTKEEIQKIKSQLPKIGAAEMINKNLETKGLKSYADSHIRGVLSGHRSNEAIVLAAHEVARDWQLKINNAKNQINHEESKN